MQMISRVCSPTIFLSCSMCWMRPASAMSQSARRYMSEMVTCEWFRWLEVSQMTIGVGDVIGSRDDR